MLELKKGDKVVYLGNMPYKLSNGQEVEIAGTELLIQNDVNVQKKFFKKIEEKIKEEKKESTDVKQVKPKVEKKEIKNKNKSKE